jgi:hypothetical protein
MKMVADHANSFLARHELIVTAKLPTSTHFNAQPEGSISGGNSGTECGCLKGCLNSPLNRQDRAIHRPSSCASHWRKRLLAAGKRVTNYYLTAWPIAHFVQKKSYITLHPSSVWRPNLQGQATEDSQELVAANPPSSTSTDLSFSAQQSPEDCHEDDSGAVRPRKLCRKTRPRAFLVMSLNAWPVPGSGFLVSLVPV